MPRRGSAVSAEREGVAAVDRALAIVATLERAAKPLSLAEIARGARLYKSTALRLLASLERGNLVAKRPDHNYALGQLAFRVGRAYEATYHLRECIWPVLESLVEQGSESPSFHVWHDEEARLCLFRIDSHHSTLDRVRAGDLLPMRRGAPGKVLRAFHKAGGRLPTNLVFTSFGERDPSCAAVASPVFGPDGECVGALSLSGPLERFSEGAVKRMSKMLLAAADRATHALGGRKARNGWQHRV
jgi:DNA-binding IclR family transcriptional regulator